MTLARRIDAWMLAPAPPERLAVFRVLTGAFTLGYMLVRLPALLALSDDSKSRFEPVGVLTPLGQPLSSGAWRAVLAATLLAGALYLLGARFRVVGPLYGAL